MLHSVIHGEPSNAPPLLIAHGLFGSARNWGVIAKRLSDTRPVITVDMRNHGSSPWMQNHAYSDLAEDLADVIAHHGGTADVLGHSMGGKAAMMLALTAPERVTRLIVADIAPVRYSHSQAHLIAAMRRVDLSRVTTRSDADQQLAHDVDDPTIRAFLLQSLDVRARAWRLNLDALDHWMPEILGWPAPAQSASHPVLFLSGGASDYMSRDGRQAAKSHFPRARFAKIPGAGHWLHAEKPRAFEETVRIYLNS